MNRRAFREQAPSFFAAGPEFARALGVLSDGAFKVFAHVCLHAERVSGNLVFERAELASRLGKSCSALGRHLRELVRAGVCELQAAPNQHRASALVVCEAYWPYRGEPGPHQAVPEADRQRYVASVREAFLGPPPAARPTRAWRRLGTARAYPWTPSGTRSCSAASARRWRCWSDPPRTRPQLGGLRAAPARSRAGALPHPLLAASGVPPAALRGVLEARASLGAGSCSTKFGTGRRRPRAAASLLRTQPPRKGKTR